MDELRERAAIQHMRDGVSAVVADHAVGGGVGAAAGIARGLGHGGAVAIDSPPLIFVHLQRQYQRVSWLEAADPMPAVRVGSNAQARAPPSFS